MTTVNSEELSNALTAIGAGAPAGTLESETLDFKTDSGDTKKTLRILTEAAVCFANSLAGR